METENKIATPTPKKTWARPEIILIEQGYVEHSKIRTAGREKTFVNSGSPAGGFHSINFQHFSHLVPNAITKMDYLS
ncbi:hypothetical protein [Mucilaginibacter sp. UYCu711]|uniref:hypothetical protein n=1 Tax=Mucilaginibacter sp. UYCu711 TaxID=3156339 RepID=UPI003D1D5878